MALRRDDEQQLLNDDSDDDQILDGGNFVPAIRNEEEQRAYEQEEHLHHQQQDEVVLISNEPETGGAFTYCVFYLLGIGTMTPWNFFVTAEDYWKYKFRNTTTNGTIDPDELTPLQKSFTCDLTLTATISGTVFLILNAVYGHHVSLRVKMLGTLSTILICFGMTSAFVEVDTDTWQEQFFLITLIIVVVINICSAIMSGGLYGIAGLFPSEFMTAVVSGQALCGIFTSLAIIFVLTFGFTPKTTAFIYFIMGSALILVNITFYVAVERLPYFKYYLNGGDKYKVIKAAPSHIPSEEDTGVPLEPIMRRVMGKIYLQVVAIALLYATTLAVYPAVSVLMQSENYNQHTLWTDVYYLPVANYLFFNCGDYFGRLLAGWLECPRNPQTVFLMTFVRLIYIPFILCSNSSEHYFLPVLVSHDFVFMFIIIGFGLSNGYLTNILLITVPRRVKQHEKELASSIMAASLSCGMAIGSLLSLAFVQML